MLPYILVHRPIYNVMEPILLTVLEGQPMLRVAPASTILPTLAEKIEEDWK